MREVFGLQEIKDSANLKEAVQNRMSSMNDNQRAEVQMQIGTKVKEFEARIPGEAYSPTNQALYIASFSFLTLSVGVIFIIFCTKILLIFKLLIGFFGFFWLMASWRGFARIIFRISNNRDW